MLFPTCLDTAFGSTLQRVMPQQLVAPLSTYILRFQGRNSKRKRCTRNMKSSLDFGIREQGILLISSDDSQQKELILYDGADFLHGFHFSWK